MNFQIIVSILFLKKLLLGTRDTLEVTLEGIGIQKRKSIIQHNNTTIILFHFLDSLIDPIKLSTLELRLPLELTAVSHDLGHLRKPYKIIYH